MTGYYLMLTDLTLIAHCLMRYANLALSTAKC